MKTALRLDDITPDMDYTKFNRMKKILDTYQIKPLIGVVPFNKDVNLHWEASHADFADFLSSLKAEGYVIALHGYEHLYTSKSGGIFPLNLFSEYAGVPYEKQVRMLREGKMALQNLGIETDIFMAPAHSFDKNTLKALKTCGFHCVTDGFGDMPYRREGLIFYPIAKKRSDCFSDKQGYTTLVVHTNSIKEEEFAGYEEMIAKNQNCFISYSDYLKVEAERRGFLQNSMEYLIATAKRILVKLRT